MPLSQSFEARLLPSLPLIVDHFGTPFHIYDEAGIIETDERLKRAFRDVDFREYFAVKALPNPAVLRIMSELGFGFDCSSTPEIATAQLAGAVGEDIMFTSNNTSMTSLMRPALYEDAYHHITAPYAVGRPEEVVDVVGSVCENSDKFARQRALPAVAEGDILLIHDTGAHGHSMGFNYNGRLRPKELLLRRRGSVELIRSEEVIEKDYFSTLRFERKTLNLHAGGPWMAARASGED